MNTIDSLALKLKQKSRMELIDEIRKFAHSETFHQVLKWPTEALRRYILDHHSQQEEARELTNARL